MTEELSTPRRGRRLAGVLAGVLALGIIPFAFPASSQTADAELRDITAPPEESSCPVDDNGTPNDPSDDTTIVPEDNFTDSTTGTFEFEIDCVAWYDVTSGATATTYNPFGEVSRGQMATFIANLIDYADDNALDAAAEAGDAFPCPSDPNELVETDTHYVNIQRLADADIVLGGPADLPADCYGPSMRVTRAQMATFINNAQTFLGVEIEPPPTIPTTTLVDATTTTTVAGPVFPDFFDDDDDSVHEHNINAIASEGIVVGTGNRMYRPSDDIERGQMAAYLARKLDYLIENGAAEIAPVPTTTTTTTSTTSTTSTTVAE